VRNFTGHCTSHVTADGIPTTPINQSPEMLEIGPIDVTALQCTGEWPTY